MNYPDWQSPETKKGKSILRSPVEDGWEHIPYNELEARRSARADEIGARAIQHCDEDLTPLPDNVYELILREEPPDIAA